MSEPTPPGALVRLVGVYNAEHTLRGELAYLVGNRLGRAHCALCDITHATVRQKKAWRECRADLAVPFDTFHLDDQPEAARRASGGTAPVVLAELATGWAVLLGPDELEACAGSVERLLAAVRGALDARGIGADLGG